ncbi:hypothetical protein KCU89_g156, partial [Aureobasidium melanogenum]
LIITIQIWFALSTLSVVDMRAVGRKRHDCEWACSLCRRQVHPRWCWSNTYKEDGWGTTRGPMYMRIIYCRYGLVVGGVALFIHDLRQLANPSFGALS